MHAENSTGLQGSAINKIPNIPQCMYISTPPCLPDPPFRFFEGLALTMG